VEIKSGQAVASDMFKALKKWQTIAASPAEPCLVFGGDGTYFRSNVHITGWREMLDDSTRMSR
jgi:hypothetical protein